MSSSLTLNCLLWGEYSWKTSAITIESTKSVADLKEAIRSKRPITLRGIGDVDISIYNVNDPILIPIESTDVHTHREFEDAVVRICQGTQLSSKQKLSEFFPTALDDENLHIVIKVPLHAPIPPVTLLCIINAKVVDATDVFHVTIDRRETILDLEDVIKKAALDSRDHALTGRLRIWSVSIPFDDSFGERVKEVCSRRQILSTLRPLSIYFPVQPKYAHLHVIVEIPTAKMFDLPFSSRNLPLFGLDRARKLYSEVNRPQAPSAGAVVKTYLNRQKKEDQKLLCGRPRDTLPVIPVQLLHPVFGQFADDCQAYPVTAIDNARVLELANSMSELYEVEDDRAEAIRAAFKEELDLAFICSLVGEYATDGDISVDGFRYAFMEFKNEVGTEGAEPYFQASLNYFEATRDFAHQWPDSTFPCFLVLVFGPYLSIAGAVWTERPTLHVLSAALPFHYHYTDVQMQTNIARHLCALKKGIKSLDEYYRGLGRPSPHTEIPPQCFPYPVEFTDRLDGGRRVFRYTAQVAKYNLVFSAITADSKREIIIKFVQAYSQEAHSFCAERGYAPALLGFERLPGGWFMVVMESLQNQYVTLAHATPNLCNAIEEKLVEFHQAGFVHGDFRDVNIMVLKSNKELFMLIDFDWAGKIGEVRYPPNVSRTDIWRPTDVADGELIKAEHDMAMLQHLR